MSDTLALAQNLIRCKSVTPSEDGVLTLLQKELTQIGFTCTWLKFDEPGTVAVDNLYARIGTTAPHFCFAGHTDVVPTGDLAAWSFDPFAATVKDGVLYGRGASDMKGAVAAFVTAVKRHGKPKHGSISLLITNDEEAAAINGTKKVLGWLKDKGEKIDACLVGEPTNPEHLGDMIKIGRRGTFNGVLRVTGKQGHVAYPHLADNPVPPMLKLLNALGALKLDDGSEHFQPSHLAIVSVDVGNPAENIIPAAITAKFNIRFNDRHTGKSLESLIRKTLDGVGISYDLKIRVGGESFYTAPGALTALVASAVKKRTGRKPELSTTGGTSDARFIRDVCPVVEFGGVSKTIHQVNENARIDDLDALSDIYFTVLEDYFKAF